MLFVVSASESVPLFIWRFIASDMSASAPK